jgi:4-amino-4-deoxy-L-arabinose transferase-like glycosyltransferase
MNGRVMQYLTKSWPIIAILLLGLILRVIYLSSSPIALYGDELTMVYDTYSILHTAHDQTGAFLPITFTMGSGRPAGYVYGSIPFVALFGPSALGVRGLSVISGLGIILLIFLLGRTWFSTRIGLWAALFTAISPWDLTLSRGGFETHFGLFLTLLGIYCLTLIKKGNWYLVAAAICFGLTIHTYPTYKLTLPLFLILYFWFSGIRVLVQNKLALLVSVGILLLAVGLSIGQTSTAEARFNTINVFSQKDLEQQLIQKINFERSVNTFSPMFIPLFHNKFIEYSVILLDAYFKNLSFEYLFWNGDGNPRHNMTSSGVLFVAQIMLILLGLVWLIRKGTHRLWVLLLGWILIAPLATTLLLVPHSLRNSFLLPPLILFSGIGFEYLWENRVKLINKILILGICLGIGIQLLFMLERMYFVYPNSYGRFWSYPAKQAVEIARSVPKNELVILSDKIDNIEYAYPVYQAIDPNQVISQQQNKYSLNGLSFKKYDNVLIGHIPEDQLDNFLSLLAQDVTFIGAYEQSRKLRDYQTIDGSDHVPSLVIKEKR